MNAPIPTPENATARMLREATDAFVRLAALVADADEIQWEPGKAIKPPDETGRKRSGEVSDPTSAVALDSRRLDVRVAQIEAVAAISKAKETITAAHHHLSDALAAWAGEPDLHE